MCPVCPYTFNQCKFVKSQVTNYTHEIKDNINCDTENVIYYWKCVKPNCKLFPKCEYIGLSTRSFKTCYSEHQQYVRSQTLTQPSGENFNIKGHNITHIQGLAIEHVKSSDPFVLRAREWRLIQKMDIFRNGLNKESWNLI